MCADDDSVSVGLRSLNTFEIKKSGLLETGLRNGDLILTITKPVLHYFPNKQKYDATVAIFSKLKILIKTPNVPKKQNTLDSNISFRAYICYLLRNANNTLGQFCSVLNKSSTVMSVWPFSYHYSTPH
jgi:hypothetical protein